MVEILEKDKKETKERLPMNDSFFGRSVFQVLREARKESDKDKSVKATNKISPNLR